MANPMIIIGIADYRICRSPDILTTLGLGSCVGITVYDKIRKIAGLSHIMLPTSQGYPGQSRKKFADSAIVDMINEMGKTGAQRAGLVAKIAGGAHMFGGGSANVLKVGERNVAAVIEILNFLKIPIIANDTGGKYGRTIELNAENGQLKIRTVGMGEKFI